MRIERTLIDLARLEALDFSKGFLGLGDSELEGASLIGAPSHHELPAAVASDPLAIGCVVGRSESGATTLLALTFDGKSIGHYTLPHSGDSATQGWAYPASESSACEVRQLERPTERS